MDPVQSVEVLTAGGVMQVGEGGVPGPHYDRSASILHTCGVLSCLVGQ